MGGSLQTQPIVVRGSRRRGAWLLAGAALFVMCGAVEFVNGQRLVALVTIAFFGFGGILGLWTLVSPNQLEIAPLGITQRILWRTRRFAWTDIYNFRATTIGLTSKTVGFDFLKPRPGGEGLRKFNAAVVGVQGSFGPGWEMDSASLAALLNQAREQWLEAPTGPVAAPISPSATVPAASGGLAGARLNRKTYLIAAAVLVAIAIGLGMIPGVGRSTSSIGGIFFIWLYSARLHDVGRSGWWQAGLYAMQVVLAIAMIPAGSQWAAVSTLAILLLQLIFTVGLGVVPGQKGANRFGPAPGEPTLAEQTEVFR
jgi:uncharacterized membrane protein YhaH (DUF805 family)